MSSINNYGQLLPDGGQLYAETNPEQFIVEPWNAVSSLIIALPAIYWAYRLRGSYLLFGFLTWCIPLLLLNGIGSAMFHAFRSSSFFLRLDVIPAIVLTISVSVYFWMKILPKWWQMFFIFLPTFYLRYMLYGQFSPHKAINITYIITGTLLFLPILKFLYDSNFKNAKIIILALFSLLLALLFREMDAWHIPNFPMGTHFMWHLMSGIGGFLLASYLYRVRLEEIRALYP